MKRTYASVSALASGLVASVAGAQSGALLGVTRPDMTSGAQDTGWTMAVMALAAVGLLVLAGIGVRLLHLRRRRADEAEVLQSRMSDLLMQDHTLGRVPVTVTAHVPLRPSAPLDVMVTGVAPTFAIGDAVHRLVERELARSGVSYRLEDHIAVEENVLV